MSQEILECKQLSKYFDGLKAFDDFNASFEAGQVAALVGPNGAGKSTILHLISGLIRPTKGTIAYRGLFIHHLSPWKVARLGIGLLFQDIRLFANMTVLDNICVVLQPPESEYQLWDFLHPFQRQNQEKDLKDKAIQWLTSIGFQDHAQKLAGELSYGQQKLLAMLRLQAIGANVFLLDEPMAGLDQGSQQEIIHLIHQLKKASKIVILVEHHWPFVRAIADRVYLVHEGNLVMTGSTEDVLSHPNARLLSVGL